MGPTLREQRPVPGGAVTFAAFSVEYRCFAADLSSDGKLWFSIPDHGAISLSLCESVISVPSKAMVPADRAVMVSGPSAAW